MGSSSSKLEGVPQNGHGSKSAPILGGSSDPLAALEAELAAAAALEADQELELQMLEQEMELEMEAADAEDVEVGGSEGDADIDPDEMAELEGELAELEEELLAEQGLEGAEAGSTSSHEDLSRSAVHTAGSEALGPSSAAPDHDASCQPQPDGAGVRPAQAVASGGSLGAATTSSRVESRPADSGGLKGEGADGLASAADTSAVGENAVDSSTDMLVSELQSGRPSPLKPAAANPGGAGGVAPDADELEQLRAEMGL